MYSFLVILCTATALLRGVSCQLFPRAILEQVTNNLEVSKVYKRQDVDAANKTLQCALDRFNAFYQGNNSRLVTECRSVALLQDDLDARDGQVSINTRFSTLCSPECGNVLLDVYDACGAYVTPHERNLMANLCGSNHNGNFCYELLLETRALINTAARCTIDHEAVTCNCPAITKGVEARGCCMDIVNNLLEMLKALEFVGDLDLDAVYDDCNVNVPKRGCNNSPLTASSSLLRASYVTTVAIVLSLVLKLL